MKKRLVTREGFNKLRQEHDYLWQKKRPEITKIVTWAASLGDRSENADYQYNKRLLRQIDRRVRYLRKIFTQFEIIDYSPQQDGKVFFGAMVEIENLEGDKKKLRIVGIDEICAENKEYISVNAPMAKALIGKQVDDEIKVSTPTGCHVWYINKINY